MMVDALQGTACKVFWVGLSAGVDAAQDRSDHRAAAARVAYLTFWERKVIGWMQVRIGPNRVGPWGLIQPIADGLKLLLKEVVFRPAPTRASF
jgi:hypothetical protein